MLYRIVTKYFNGFRHSMHLSKAYFNYTEKQALPFSEVKRIHFFEEKNLSQNTTTIETMSAFRYKAANKGKYKIIQRLQSLDP